MEYSQSNSQTTHSYLSELLTSAAVKAEAAAHSGSDDLYAGAQMRTCATALALLVGQDNIYAQELIEGAKNRAKIIFSNGEDWRRELRLYDNLTNYMKLLG